MARKVTLHLPDAAHPGYFGPGDWRLVDKHGTAIRDSDGVSMSFSTDRAALAWLVKHDIPLLPPRLA